MDNGNVPGDFPYRELKLGKPLSNFCKRDSTGPEYEHSVDRPHRGSSKFKGILARHSEVEKAKKNDFRMPDS